MQKLRWNGIDKKIILLGYRENKKAIATLIGYLEKQTTDLPPIKVHILKSDEVPDLPGESIAAFSFLSTRWNQVKKIILANKDKEIVFVGGGPHPAGKWQELLEKNFFQIIFTGEGEKAFYQFTQFIAGNLELNTIKGICYNDDGKIICNPLDPLPSLDLSPGYTRRYSIFPSIEISRGCPYLCQYCQTPFLLGRKPRHRSLENTLHIVDIYLKKGKKDFRFISPNAFGYLDPSPKDDYLFLKLITALHNKIDGKGRIFIGSFPSEVRPDYVTPAKVEIVKKYCSNDNLVLGAQSGSSKILKKMKRAHSVEDVINAVEIIISYGLIANVDFIFGNPGETEEDIEATIWLIHKLIEMGAKIHGHYFMPLPGTPWEKEKPVKWPKKYLRIIGDLSRKGQLYGSWSNQLKIAEELLS